MLEVCSSQVEMANVSPKEFDENERFKEGWKAENSKDDPPATTKRRSTKEKPRYGEFNVEDAFAKALERSYGASDDEE